MMDGQTLGICTPAVEEKCQAFVPTLFMLLITFQVILILRGFLVCAIVSDNAKRVQCWQVFGRHISNHAPERDENA
jgi:uncharacterized membrane protein